MLGRKVIYVRCLKCSYNKEAKYIRLLDEKAFFVIQEKLLHVRAFERYIMILAVTRIVSSMCMVILSRA